ncbi:MAG: ribonucleotide reductase subunit alpha [Pseudomonadota bacterium]
MGSQFQQLLSAAAAQPQPQRLLFVFAGAELPADASDAQRVAYERGEGGALAPLMCVDKAPEELSSFEALVAESRTAGPPWQVVFVAALSGREGEPPPGEQLERALQHMVDAVKQGAVERFLAFNPQGETLSFS